MIRRVRHNSTADHALRDEARDRLKHVGVLDADGHVLLITLISIFNDNGVSIPLWSQDALNSFQLTRRTGRDGIDSIHIMRRVSVDWYATESGY